MITKLTPPSPGPHRGGRELVPRLAVPSPAQQRAGLEGSACLIQGTGLPPSHSVYFPPLDATLVAAVGAAPFNVGQEAGVTTSHPA